MANKVAALIPAAGISRRMGSCKALLPFGESTAIERVVATLGEAGVEEILAILGPTGDEVARVLAGTAARVVWNPLVASDMAASLRIALDHLTPVADGVVVFLADHPLVGVLTLKTLIDRFRQAPDTILIPSLNGQRGHPVLLPRAVLEEIRVLPTLRDVCRRDPGRVQALPVDDPAILHDLDTPDDYRRALAWWEASFGGVS